MSHIYILALEDKKYYVGQTNNPQLRIEQHHEGSGACWTIKYKPIKILQIRPSTGPFDENNTTKELMIKYGIDQVRGGSYCTEHIDKTEKELLQKELWGVANCCIRCGKKDHYISECRKRVDVNGNKILSKSITPPVKRTKNDINNDIINNNVNNTNNNNNINNTIDKKPKPKVCKACGRNNHKTKDCFATTKLTGSPIVKKPCTRCHRVGHKKADCFATTDVNGKVLK